MHLKKHLLYIFAVLCVFGVVYFYALSDIFHPKQIASYENNKAIFDKCVYGQMCYIDYGVFLTNINAREGRL